MATKKPKKNKFNPQETEEKTNNAFAGFEEFIQSHNLHIHKSGHLDKSDEGKIHSFLETNYQRLSKISQLFQQKLNMLEKFDQSETLIRDLDRENNRLRDRIVSEYLSSESLLNRSLNAIFNSHFKEIKKN